MSYEVIIDLSDVERRSFDFKRMFDESIPCKERIVRCRDCRHSRTERHKGDEELVCWVRGTHGEVVPEDGYCFKGEL